MQEYYGNAWGLASEREKMTVDGMCFVENVYLCSINM